MTDNISYITCSSPIGDLLLTSNGSALTGLCLPGYDAPESADKHEDAVLRETKRQLAAYFAGKLQAFDLALAPQGSEFQRTVWQELGKIPFGTTISYAELARRIGQP